MKIYVVGAGISGLSAATYLSRQGHEVTLFEASEHIGGRAISLYENNVIVDVGTQFYHTNYRHTLKLIKSVGLKGSLKKVNGKVRIFNSDAGSSFLFNPVLPWYGSRGVLGNLGIGYYLLTRLLQMPLDVFSESQNSLLDVTECYNELTNELIKNTILRPLALVGTLAEPEVLNMSSLQLLRLIRVILTTGFMVLDGGNDSLHNKLSENLNILHNTRIDKIKVKNNCVELLKDGGDSISADHVVIATTSDKTATILPDSMSMTQEFLKKIQAPEFILPTIYLDRPLEKGVWAYLTHENTGSLFSYITDATQKCGESGIIKNSILQPWICYPDSKRVSGKDDSQIFSMCIEELEHYFPGIEDWVVHYNITRHGYSVPNHKPDHHKQIVNILSDIDDLPLSICGDYLFGGYVESAVSSAKLVENKILRLNLK